MTSELDMSIKVLYLPKIFNPPPKKKTFLATPLHSMLDFHIKCLANTLHRFHRSQVCSFHSASNAKLGLGYEHKTGLQTCCATGSKILSIVLVWKTGMLTTYRNTVKGNNLAYSFAYTTKCEQFYKSDHTHTLHTHMQNSARSRPTAQSHCPVQPTAHTYRQLARAAAA